MSTRPIHTRLTLTVCAALTASALLVATNAATGEPTSSAVIEPAAQPLDPEVILPSRVDAALTRVRLARPRQRGGRRSQPDGRSEGVDGHRPERRPRYLATTRQIDAAPPPDSESESTAGPDSALATLNVDQVVITEVAGLFDRVTNTTTIAALVQALSTGLDRRAVLLTKVLALDPEAQGRRTPTGSSTPCPTTPTRSPT